MAESIIVIGAGAAGLSAALELANRGYQVKLIEKDTMGSGASGRNPGRMGHGFHYTDPDTAIAYLQASIKVQRSYPGYLLDQDIKDSPLRHGRYFITKNSRPGKEEILRTYEKIRAEYARLVAEDSANEVFGSPQSFYRILDPSEYQDTVNMDIVEMGIETNEHLFLWQDFLKDLRTKIETHPKITLMEHTQVASISRSNTGQDRYKLSLVSSDGTQSELSTRFIVNSTWENIEGLNAQIGIQMQDGARTNRLKTLLIAELPESLKSVNSMFFCMGQHCMISNLGGTAMMTYAKVTNMETSSSLELSDNAKRLLSADPTPEEVQFYGQQMIEGISQYIPAMKDAKIIGLKFGIVQTQGDLKLDQLADPNHAFHRRSDHNVRAEELGLISNPCMKLFYFIDNGELVVDIIERQMEQTLLIDKVIDTFTNKARDENLPIDPRLERHLRKILERLPASELVDANQCHLVEHLLVTTKAQIAAARSNLFSNSVIATEPLDATKQSRPE